MEFDRKFKEYMDTQLEGCDQETIDKITDEDRAFIRGYMAALDDLSGSLISAREDAKDLNEYPALNDFIDQITKVVYDRTLQDMDINLDGIVTSMIEDYIE